MIPGRNLFQSRVLRLSKIVYKCGSNSAKVSMLDCIFYEIEKGRVKTENGVVKLAEHVEVAWQDIVKVLPNAEDRVNLNLTFLDNRNLKNNKNNIHKCLFTALLESSGLYAAPMSF